MRGKRILIFIFLILLSFLFIFLADIFPEHFVFERPVETSNKYVSEKITKSFSASYINTPEKVKAIYMTSWIASEDRLRSNLVKLLDETEINSLVIDIKDYSGKIVFDTESEVLKKYGSEEIRISDLKSFIEKLHGKGVYVIGRIAVFQDAYFAKHRPDLAVKDLNQNTWKDSKGISWIDPGSREYWDYIVLLAKESRKIGFDEINFDYIRYPSDGDMEDIYYPFSSTTEKSMVLENFFSYLRENLSETGLKISADLFGMTTTSNDDMGIGQVLEKALPYFDYISPMLYPSHYPPDFQGFKNPEEHPYEIISFTLKAAVDRVVKASSTPQKIRPWLQDFGLEVDYNSKDVRAQIKAVNDLGLTSWMIWSPSNKYSTGAFEKI